jgi:hypothetical protein
VKILTASLFIIIIIIIFFLIFLSGIWDIDYDIFHLKICFS